MTSSRYFSRCGRSSALASESSRRSAEVGDVVAERGEALARDLLADEVADQQAQQRLALQRREGDRRARVLASACRPLSVSV